MRVLRDNKESLMAVLEAFVYDPLINWRLMQTDVETRRQEGMYRILISDYAEFLKSVAESETDPDRAAELARVAAHPQGPSRKLKADENDIFNGTLRSYLVGIGYSSWLFLLRNWRRAWRTRSAQRESTLCV